MFSKIIRVVFPLLAVISAFIALVATILAIVGFDLGLGEVTMLSALFAVFFCAIHMGHCLLCSLALHSIARVFIPLSLFIFGFMAGVHPNNEASGLAGGLVMFLFMFNVIYIWMLDKGHWRGLMEMPVWLSCFGVVILLIVGGAMLGTGVFFGIFWKILVGVVMFFFACGLMYWIYCKEREQRKWQEV